MPMAFPVGDAAQELAALLLSTESFDDLLQGVADLTVRTMAGAVTASVTLAEHGHPITRATSDPLARHLDEYEYEYEAGPCLDALRDGQIHEAVDMRTEQRWGAFPTVALSHGVLASLAVPLVVRDDPVGVLNLYARTPHAFDERDQQLTRLLARQATLAIIAVLRNYGEITLADNLRFALSSRSVIDQAIGVVMGRHGCSADDALEMLRTVSQRRNVKLREIAAELVAAVGTPTSGDGQDRP